jgi:prevent-host-death family protein
MTITISSRQFNQDAAGAKRAARQGPVFITDRGRPAHVLLSIEQYQRITGQGCSIADLLAMPGGKDAELPLPHSKEPARPADLG